MLFCERAPKRTGNKGSAIRLFLLGDTFIICEGGILLLPPTGRGRKGLLHRDGFRQIAGLVDIAAAADGDVVGNQL
jgi:hypothetical protein